jgi:hypothetical protein
VSTACASVITTRASRHCDVGAAEDSATMSAVWKVGETGGELVHRAESEAESAPVHAAHDGGPGG